MKLGRGAIKKYCMWGTIMWGTNRYEHEFNVGKIKWELYNVEYGDRESGNFGSIE